LLAALAGTYGTLLAVTELPARRRSLPHRRHWLRIAIVAAVLAASFIPIRSSVLAPAEIVAAAPFPVRAPFDGVVDAVHVPPNTPVHKGDRLISFDVTERRAKADVAAKALEMARAEFTEASQQAMSDPKVKGRLVLLQSKVAQAQLDYDYDRTMLGRAEVLAPADGIAVFDDEHQWIGRPVALGERIMIIAPPRSTELDIAVPIGDVVTFAPGAEVEFFPNVSPDQPAHGRLMVAGYGTAPTAEGVLAYTFRTHLESTDDGLRLGLKGTAKIYGPHRPFILWVLRRPLAVMREWLSL
jgi:multidrug resistance efflux pump